MIAAVSAGCAAFVLLSVADELSLAGRSLLRGVSFLAACLLLCLGMVLAAATGPRVALSPALRTVGGILGSLSAALAGISLFREVRTHRVYLGGTRERRLVTTGTYALCRHPGVLWLSVLLFSLAALTQSRDLAVAAPVWILLDVAHVYRQERRYLIPVFGREYARYRTQVPFLIPSIPSIRRALRRRNTGEDGGESAERD